MVEDSMPIYYVLMTIYLDGLISILQLSYYGNKLLVSSINEC